MGRAYPHQCLALARGERRALHPVHDPGRPHRAAGRRRRRGERCTRASRPQARGNCHVQVVGRAGTARVRDLSHAGGDARRARRAPRTCRRRRAAVPDRVGIRRGAATSAGAGATPGRSRTGAALRLAHRGRLCALAARPRPRCAGIGAVPRRGRRRLALAAATVHRRNFRGRMRTRGARHHARL